MRSSWFKHKSYWVSQEVQEVKNLPANAGDVGDLDSIPGLGRFPGEGNGNPSSTLALKIPWTEELGAGNHP